MINEGYVPKEFENQRIPINKFLKKMLKFDYKDRPTFGTILKDLKNNNKY